MMREGWRRALRSGPAALALATSGLSCIDAAAQDDAALLRDGLFARDRNVAVAERAKPEYDPIPIRVGAFIVDPSITVGLGYDDNIRASNADTASDGLFDLESQLRVSSDWARHQVTGFARVNGRYDFDHDSESTTDYAVGGSGRWDVAHDLGFTAGARYEHDTQPRSSEASPALSKSPIQFDYAEGDVEGTRAFDRLRLTAKLTVDDFSYDNGVGANGAPIYEKDQNHTDVVGAGKAEFAYSPNTSFALSLVGDTRRYRDELFGEASRNSSGYELTVGSDFDVARLVQGELYVGYLEQDFENEGFRTVGGLAVRGRVRYFPTQLTTVTLSGARSVQDSGIFNVGGFLSNTAAVQVDHELLRNLVLTSRVTYTNNDYRAAEAFDRTDKIASEEVSALYLMNRAVAFKLSYVHLNQASYGRQAGPRFDIDRVVGAATYRF